LITIEVCNKRSVSQLYNYSTASRELAKPVLAPQSGIKANGAGSHKVWVRR